MGGCLDFTSAGSDTVNVTSYTDITDLWNGGGSFAIWYFRTADTRNVRFGTKYNGSKGWLISHLTGDPIGMRFGHERAGGIQIWTSSTTPIATGSWIHCAMTWDGVVTNNPTMYFNGVADTTSVTTAQTGALVNDDGLDFWINSNSAGGTQAPEGYAAYVQMWNRELSAAEINEAMRRPGKIASGLVAYWPLTDSVTTMRNLTGFTNGTSSGPTERFDGPPVSMM